MKKNPGHIEVHQAEDALTVSAIGNGGLVLQNAILAQQTLEPAKMERVGVDNPAKTGFLKEAAGLKWLKLALEVTPWFYVIYSVILAWDVATAFYQQKDKTWQDYLITSLRIIRHLAAASLATIGLLAILGFNLTLNVLPLLIIIGTRLACSVILFSYHVGKGLYKWYQSGFAAAKEDLKTAFFELLIGTLEALSFIFFIRLDKLLALQQAASGAKLAELQGVVEAIRDTYEALQDLVIILLAVASFGLLTSAVGRAKTIFAETYEFYASEEQRVDSLKNATQILRDLGESFLIHWQQNKLIAALLSPLYLGAFIMEGLSLLVKGLFKAPVFLVAAGYYYVKNGSLQPTIAAPDDRPDSPNPLSINPLSISTAADSKHSRSLAINSTFSTATTETKSLSGTPTSRDDALSRSGALSPDHSDDERTATATVLPIHVEFKRRDSNSYSEVPAEDAQEFLRALDQANSDPSNVSQGAGSNPSSSSLSSASDPVASISHRDSSASLDSSLLTSSSSAALFSLSASQSRHADSRHESNAELGAESKTETVAIGIAHSTTPPAASASNGYFWSTVGYVRSTAGYVRSTASWLAGYKPSSATPQPLVAATDLSNETPSPLPPPVPEPVRQRSSSVSSEIEIYPSEGCSIM